MHLLPYYTVFLFFYLVVWQGYRTRWRVSGMGHTSLIFGLIGNLGVVGTNQLYHADFLGMIVLSRTQVNLIRDGFAIMSVVSFYLFRLAAEEYTIRSPRVWRAISGGVAEIAVLAVIVLLSPHMKGRAFGYHWSMSHPVGGIYFKVEGTYLAVVLLMVARWLVKYAREQGKHFRVGLRIAAVGAYGLSALLVTRTIPMVTGLLGITVPYVPTHALNVWTAIFAPLLFIGLSYPVLASRVEALGRWRGQRETYSKLRMVWKACTTLYPETVLPLRTLTRRRTECIDGLYKFLAGNELPVNEPGRRAAEALREVVRRYDEVHESPVADVVYRAVEEKDDAVDRRGQLRDNDPVMAMLLQLAELLNDTS